MDIFVSICVDSRNIKNYNKNTYSIVFGKNTYNIGFSTCVSINDKNGQGLYQDMSNASITATIFTRDK